MKIITIAVPEEEIISLEAFLQQSNITVLDESDDEPEVYLYEVEIDELEVTSEEDLLTMKEMEQELEAEIWCLHHLEPEETDNR